MAVPETVQERMELLEELRRLAWAMKGEDYPEPSTPEQRRHWPMGRIEGCSRTSSISSSS